jgi:hypothetical protein
MIVTSALPARGASAMRYTSPQSASCQTASLAVGNPSGGR